jgi:hypothetical protein
MLLAARGDFCDSNLWIVCEFDSPVGRDAQGPGIHEHRQRLLSVALAGGDMMVPAVVLAPTEDMAMTDLVQSALAAQLQNVVARLRHVADRVKAYTGEEKLQAFGLTLPALAAYDPLSALLVPEIHVGPLTVGGWPAPVTLAVGDIASLAKERHFKYAVIESGEQPYGAESRWTRVEPAHLRRLAGLICSSGLDIGFRPSSVAYWARNDGCGLHRRAVADDLGARAVATELGYSLIGFDLKKHQDLAKAIAYVEFVATSSHIQRCAKRFGDQLTPSLVKAHDCEQRGLLRALRATYNAALVAVGRARQAES